MNNKKDGGPAFPIICEIDPNIGVHSGGMSLRDYFAINDEIKDQLIKDIMEQAGIQEFNAETYFKIKSKLKYIAADSMIEERDNNGDINE